MSEMKLLEDAKECLDYFRVDYSGDVIKLHDGHLSMIFNTGGHFSEKIIGHSVCTIATYVAKKTGKEIQFT
jgi:hypothetical protein